MLFFVSDFVPFFTSKISETKIIIIPQNSLKPKAVKKN